MVRNPMYLGRFVMLSGFVLLLGSGWLVGFTIAYWAYMDARVQREEAHLRPISAPPTRDYRRNVRRFVPGWRCPGAGRVLGTGSFVRAEQTPAQRRHTGRGGARGGAWPAFRPGPRAGPSPAGHARPRRLASSGAV